MINITKLLIITFIAFFLLVNNRSNLFSQDVEPNTSSEKQSTILKILSYMPPKKKLPEDKIWYFSIGGWYSEYDGNTDTLNSNFKTTLEMDNDISNFLISFSGFYDEAKSITTKKKGSGITKYDHYILPRIELFVFSQSEYNKMSLLDHRNNSGAGAKFVFIKNDLLKIDISGALIYQFENYETESHTTDYRWSLRYRTKIVPLPELTFSFVYFYIPKVDDSKSYRLILDTYAKVKITKHVSFKIAYINKYNKEALTGTEKTDKNLYARIELKF